MGCNPNTQENGHQGMAKHDGHKSKRNFDGPSNFQSPCNMAAKKSGIQAKNLVKKAFSRRNKFVYGCFHPIIKTMDIG